MKYILKASDIYYGLSVKELRKLAYEYAKRIGISYPDTWDANREASSDWQLGFMKRHPSLSLRTPEKISLQRAKAFNKENVDTFFKNLSSVLNENHFEPQRIFNVDETGLPTVPTKATKIISYKGKKRVGTSTSQERGTNVTMALSVSATGQSIPPFYLFPRQKMKEVFMTHASHGAVGIANGSGWMTSEEFSKYMQHFIKHTGANAESPSLLLLDNHTSHLSIEALDLAIKHGITMLSFPPHCTHRMQPLDITVFGPFKTAYAIEHDAWKKNNVGRTFDLHHVPLIAAKCLDVAVTPKNIKAGFKAAGIYPFDPHVFNEKDFVASQLSGEKMVEDDDDTDNQHRIVLADEDIAAHEEEAIPVPSTSTGPSTSGASSKASVTSKENLLAALQGVLPLKAGTPAKKSNRGRKSMQSAVLTSPEVVCELRDKAEKKREREAKKGDTPSAKKQKVRGKSKTPQKKQPSPTDTDVEEDVDFCIICMKSMPKKMNRQNTIHCNVCDRAVHLKCAKMTASYWTCKHCISD